MHHRRQQPLSNALSDKTGNVVGGYDYWIRQKLDADGIRQWLNNEVWLRRIHGTA